MSRKNKNKSNMATNAAITDTEKMYIITVDANPKYTSDLMLIICSAKRNNILKFKDNGNWNRYPGCNVVPAEWRPAERENSKNTTRYRITPISGISSETDEISIVFKR